MARPTHQFSQTKRADIPRSSFDLSHGHKTSFDGGDLIPILSLEVLPGDTINCRASLFGRLATPIKPILDNLYLETFFFFVPYRQVWTNWVKFNGEQVTPGDSIDFTVPILTDNGAFSEDGLFPYFGIPKALIADNTPVSALPFRCYNAVFNFWFRDENLVDPRPTNIDDGPDTASNYQIQRRRKRRDYLTSALPWPQKGDAVVVPLGDRAPVMGIAVGSDAEVPGGSSSNMKDSVSTGVTYTNQFQADNDNIRLDATGSGGSALLNIYADLTSATAISINSLRESFQIQKLLERDARGGTRYPEILKSHFQVTDPSLLVHQRPLFLGGGSSMINITPVQQTGETATTPQGNLAAYGTVSGQNHGFTASFTEHGHIIGVVNVRADLSYQQGLERYFSRSTRYDFYWPALAHLGEQAILNKEIFVSDVPAIDDAVFGYIPRYDEYRFKPSQISGAFRSDYSASLDVWHLAQDFSSLPALNDSFIEDNPPIDRVSAVPSEPQMLLDVYFKIRAARPLPLYATPGLIDHF